MADDDFFGYDIASLRQSSAELPTLPPNLQTQAIKENWYSDRASVSHEDVPAPEDNGRDIEFIHTQIMGEQPGTAEFRALQWGKAGLLLASVQNQLRDQTKELADAWESPRAKEIFLDKVGMTLAYLDVWHEATTTNSYALTVLAGIMREGQDEMRDLYAEYEAAMKRSRTAEELARALPPTGGNASSGSTVQKARDMVEPGPPSTQGGERWRAEMRETMRTAEENKANYDRWARELASRVGEQYTPVIQRLELGRAHRMTPLNAVNHPEAYGMPLPDAPPGGPGPGPGPGTPPSPPPGTPPSPPPNGLKDKLPSPDELKDKLPSPDDKKAPDLPDAPKAPDPTSLLNPGPPPTAPNLPGPPVPNPAGMPDLSPQTLTALTNALTALGPGLGGLTANSPTLNASQTSQFTARATAAPTGLYPPNTITPPPGGLPNQPKQQGKVLGQRASQTPPPGATGRANSADRRRNATPGTETPQAFQPPPSPGASVLGDRKGRRTRPGSAQEAPSAQLGMPPGATSPVLSNPRRANGPAKTYGEQRAERRRERQQRPEATPEIAAGVSTGTAPVLSGRFDPAPETSEAAPITLRGRAPVVRDQHAPPEVRADRTARAPRQAEPVVAEQSAWEVENPGGPVVAAEDRVRKQYRPEPPNALGAR